MWRGSRKLIVLLKINGDIFLLKYCIEEKDPVRLQADFQNYSDETLSKYQKQPSRSVHRKRCSENMLQIYRRTLIPKCDFNKVALLCNFIEITLRHGCSPVILLHIFRKRIYKNTSALAGCFWNINVDFPTARPCEHDRKIERKYVDNSGTFGPLMTDLSKAFDCLHQGLLIAKLNGHDFDMKSVKLIQQYLQAENKVLR